MDYFLVLAYTNARLTDTISSLRKLYEVLVCDSFGWFLGVQLGWSKAQDRRLPALPFSWLLHTAGVLRRFGMKNFKPVSTPKAEPFWSGFDNEWDPSSKM